MSREVRNSIFGIYQITTLLINLPIFANLIWQIDVFFIWNKRINKFYYLLIKFSCKNNKLFALSLNFIFASIILSGIIIKFYYLNLLNSKLSFIRNKSYITNHHIVANRFLFTINILLTEPSFMKCIEKNGFEKCIK